MFRLFGLLAVVVIVGMSTGLGCQCSPPVGKEEGGSEGWVVSKDGGERETLSPEGKTEPVQEPTKEPVREQVLKDGGDEPVVEVDGGEMIPESGMTEMGPDFTGPRFSFRVVSKTEDVVPPKLVSVSFQPTTVKAGELLQVLIKVGKDLSGVVGAQLTLGSTTGTDSLYITTKYHPSKKAFYGLVRFSPFATKGTWKIQRLNLLDAANNPSVYRGDQPPLDTLSVNVLENRVDKEAPKVQSFALDVTNVKAGGEVPFRLKVSDNASGIQYVEVTAEGPNSAGQVRSDVLFDPILGEYRGRFRIPLTGPDGVWQVSQVSISDVAGNFGGLSASDPILKGKTFSVTDSTPKPPSDTKPPVVSGGWLGPVIVNEGKQIGLRFDAKDMDSRIRWVEVRASDPNAEIRFQFNMFFNAALGLWEGTGGIPLFSRPGLWKIAQVQLFDYQGNETTLKFSDLQTLSWLSPTRLQQVKKHLALQVTPPGPGDVDAPVVKGVNLSPGSIQVGESARLYVQLQDPGGSGIDSASCTFAGPLPNQQKTISLSYNADTAFFEGNIAFSVGSPASVSGEWWLSGCYVSDRSGNATPVSGRILSELPPLDISRVTTKPGADPFVVSVSGAGAPPKDQVGPVMKSMHLYPGTLKQGERIRVFADVSDVAGEVSQGACTFGVVEGVGLGYDRVTSMRLEMRYHAATGLWESTGDIPLEAVPGRWVIQECQWYDDTGNQTAMSPRDFVSLPATTLNHLTVALPKEHRGFTVQPAAAPPSDVTAPVFDKVGMYPPTVTPGERVRVYAQVTDVSPLKEVFCSLKPSLLERPGSSYGAAHLKWNPATKLWEGEYRVSRLSRGGIWSLAGCQAEDIARNVNKKIALDMPALPKLDVASIVGQTLTKVTSLTVAPSNLFESDPPVLVSAVWLPGTQRKAGDLVTVQVDATDTGSGVLSVEVAMSSPTGRARRSQLLQWNPATSRWEGTFRIPLYAEDGLWFIDQVQLNDASGNVQTYSKTHALLKDKTLTVSGTKALDDKLPPTVKSVKLNKAVVLAGESIRVVIDATDDLSGVSNVGFDMVSPSQSFRASVYPEWNPVTKRWEGNLSIPKVGEDGVWKAVSLSVSDRVGRSFQAGETSDLLKNLALTVRGSSTASDKKGPDIRMISMIPSSITAGGQTRVIAEVVDADSSVADVSVQLESPQKRRLLFFSLTRNSATGFFEATLTVPARSPSGVWKIVEVSASDTKGNRTVLSSGGGFLP